MLEFSIDQEVGGVKRADEARGVKVEDVGLDFFLIKDSSLDAHDLFFYRTAWIGSSVGLIATRTKRKS